MNQDHQSYELGPPRGRIQWGSFGFLAGIFLGILIGWFFAGFVGAFIRVAMVALIAIPIVLLFIGWRRFVAPLLRPSAQPQYSPSQYPHSLGAIETTAVVHTQAREPQPR
jgi:hypothetical protein